MLVHLTQNADDRGRFIETYRREWFPGTDPMIQGNRSDSLAGVVRALHYHLRQAHYRYVPRRRILRRTCDLRRSSPTHGRPFTIEIGEGAEIGVYIPPGVAHGFQALADSTLTYLVDRYYDPSDEQGVAWDDPDIGIAWPIRDAILSDRDRTNPRLRDIPNDGLPA